MSLTQDQDVIRIRWLPIDLDPKRPAGISATDEEVAAAVAVGKKIAAWLEGELGFAKGIRAYSGNGFHLLYRLPDLPNNEETHKIIVAAMAAIKAKFDSDKVDVDGAVTNSARLWKLYQTTGRKGDATPDRPHRKSALLPKQPSILTDVPITDLDTLKKLAALSPQAAIRGNSPPANECEPPGKTTGATRFKESTLGPLDMERYLGHYGIGYTIKSKGAQTLYCLDHCLFNPDHDQGQASIIAAPTGKSPLLYQCFHASCKDKRWKDARQIISGDKPVAEFCAGYDPKWKPPKQEGTGAMAAIAVRTAIGIASDALVESPEKIDPLEFFEKRGKRPVFVPRYFGNYLAAYLSPIVHTSGEFWRYRDGIWTTFPETMINQLIVHALKEYWQDNYQTSAIKILKGLVNQEEKMWTQFNNLVPCLNGMLDMDTMTLKDHDPKYGNRYQLPVTYREKAWSNRWWEFLAEIFPDDSNFAKRAILQQFFGYCLLRDCRYETALFLYGTGANGKSTVLNVLEAMLGRDNCSAMSLEELCDKFSPYFLQNKLVNMATETNSRNPMGTEMLKKMISGDKVTCEMKYQQKFQFRPFAKFIAALNDPPVIPDKSYGFSRRVLVVNFTRRFQPEEISARALEIGGVMKDFLIEEVDGVFGWALEGLKALLKNAGFRIPAEVRKDTDDMLETLNPLLIFVNEMCVVHTEASVGTVEFFEHYEGWCAAGRNRPLGRNRFLDQITQTFPNVKKGYLKGTDTRGLIGIGLSTQAYTWFQERQNLFRKKD